ncbi:MAG TPA: matrixin family metalloprotease [Candidatus Fimivivens sp.]|nr:matrixin family metalloprotease [Candidatus Fimivivens sp.]
MERAMINRFSRLTFLCILGGGTIGTALFVAPDIFHLPESRPGCDAPIYWSLGNVDLRFPIDQHTFLLTALEAARLWNDRTGKELLVYDPQASFSVVTVFDDRQRKSYAAQSLQETVDRFQKDAETLKKTYESLRVTFERDQTTLSAHLRSYQDQLASYNDDVSRVNAKGGASADEFESLEKMRKKLSREQESLTYESDRVSAEAARMNAIAAKLNTGTASVNGSIRAYRQKYGDSQPFIEGLYESPLRSITVYEFNGTDDLRLVLAHEFGHALGIENHVEHLPSAVMYAMMGEQDVDHPALTDADLTAYEAACPAEAEAPRDAFVRYLVTTPYSEMSPGVLLKTLSR